MIKDKPVLWLDDDPVNGKIVRTFLCNGESFRLMSVNSNEEFRHFLRDHPEVDKILIDLHHYAHDGKPWSQDVVFRHNEMNYVVQIKRCGKNEDFPRGIALESATLGKESLPDSREEARAEVSEEEPCRDQVPQPPLEDLCHLLKNHCPMLYNQVLEPTFADLRYEHSVALSEGHPGKAHWILLRGCCALAAAAARQLAFSLLDRLAAFWQTRSIK